MKHVFILNPVAGKSDRSKELIAHITTVMAARGLTWSAHITECVGHAIALAREAARAGGAVRIYACGGDGTLNEVANGAAGFDNAAVTHYPTGSGNDFIKLLGDGADRFTDLDALLDGEVVPIDLINCNGRLSINICSVGLDARIARDMVNFKRRPFVTGALAYQLATVTNVIKGIHQPYRVEVDGEEFGGRFTLLCACNGQYYGGTFHPAPDAVPDDGVLTFLLAKDVSRLRTAGLVGKYGAGLACEIPEYITIRHGRRMKITCARPNALNIDGECSLATEIDISLSEKKLHFLRPAGTNWV